jgi:tetratricopeptide (TPR) repeat protein
MKKYLLIGFSILLLIFIAGIYFFDKFFLIKEGKIINRFEYEKSSLEENLSESYQKGNLSGQIDSAMGLAKLRNSDNKAKIDLANVFLEKGSLEFREEEYANKALVLINEVLEQEQDNAEAYLAAGYAYEILQDYKKSLDYYNKAVELDPNNNIYYVKRGHAYDLSGDLLLAEKDYIKSYELNNENDTALMNLARIAQRKGDWQKAKTYAEDTIDISKISYVKATSHGIVGLYYLEEEKYPEAIDSFTNAINSYKNYGNAYSNRAYSKILLNDYKIDNDTIVKEIESDLNTAIQIYENDSFAYVVYGLLMESVNNKKESLSYYQKALSQVDVDITLGFNEKKEMKEKIIQSIIYLNN